MKIWKYLILAAVAAVAIGCADELTPSQNQNNGENSGEGKEPEQVDTTPVQLSGMVMGSGRWFGYDLQEKHVITTVYFTPKASQGKKVELGLFEGANQADFSDALPIAMIKEQCQDGVRSSLAINCSRGFRYVRYMSPSGTQYNLSELTFYGYKAPGDDSQFYQVTNLPTVVINTQGGKAITSKTTEVSSNVYIISREGKDLLSTTQTGVRVRGNASWDFPQEALQD